MLNPTKCHRREHMLDALSQQGCFPRLWPSQNFGMKHFGFEYNFTKL